MIDPWEELANAIILQAVKDYRDSLYLLKWHRFKESAAAMKKDCEHFLCSDWFRELTNLDGEMLMKRLQEETV